MTHIEKTKGIVLHSFRHGESSLIVHCFTRNRGRQVFLVKGVRKSRKNNRANLFQPLFLLDMDVYYNPSREMQWIREVSIDVPLNTIPYDVTRSTQALFLSEILYRMVREQEENEVLYHFIRSSVQYLDSMEVPSSSFHLLCLFQLTKYLGFYPQDNYSETRIFFDPHSGSFTEVPSSGKLEQEKELGNWWRACFQSNYDSANHAFGNRHDRNLFLNSLLEYYRIHVEGSGEIRSVDIIREIFNNA